MESIYIPNWAHDIKLCLGYFQMTIHSVMRQWHTHAQSIFRNAQAAGVVSA
jgi:hypothetical protein